jgi:peptidylprolyl isomerase
MRILSFVTLALISGALVSAQEQRTSVAAPPADVKAAPADAQKTPSGLASKVIKEGTGTTHPRPTDVVTVHYTGWKSSDSAMFDSTVLRGKPQVFMLNRTIPGLSEGIGLMVQGEKRRLWVPESLAHKGQREPKGNLVFDVELIGIESTDAPPDVAKAPADAIKTASGLAYKVLTPGTGGRHPRASSTVTVNYTGWSTDGKMFDSTIPKGMPISFELDGVIKGWTEGVQLMTEGEKMRFWIPDTLAYKGIPQKPQGMLVFDIELVAIK